MIYSGFLRTFEKKQQQCYGNFRRKVMTFKVIKPTIKAHLEVTH